MSIVPDLSLSKSSKAARSSASSAARSPSAAFLGGWRRPSSRRRRLLHLDRLARLRLHEREQLEHACSSVFISRTVSRVVGRSRICSTDVATVTAGRRAAGAVIITWRIGRRARRTAGARPVSRLHCEMIASEVAQSSICTRISHTRRPGPSRPNQKSVSCFERDLSVAELVRRRRRRLEEQRRRRRLLVVGVGGRRALEERVRRREAATMPSTSPAPSTRAARGPSPARRASRRRRGQRRGTPGRPGRGRARAAPASGGRGRGRRSARATSPSTRGDMGDDLAAPAPQVVGEVKVGRSFCSAAARRRDELLAQQRVALDPASSIRMRQSGCGQQKRRQQLKADACTCSSAARRRGPRGAVLGDSFSTFIQNFRLEAAHEDEGLDEEGDRTKKSTWTVSKRWSRWSSSRTPRARSPGAARA